jgi:integrase
VKITLTDRLLRSLAGKPREKPAELWDRGGLVVRAGRTGTVAFGVMGRRRGMPKPIRIPIGTYPPWTLAEARAAARELLRDLQSGIDPRQARAAKLQAETASISSLFANVAEQFITKHVSKARTARAIELRIRRELIPRWGNWQITAITRSDIAALIEEIVDRGHVEGARQTHLYVRRLFGWAIGRNFLQHNPADGISLKDLGVNGKKPRARVLSDRELALIWAATADGAFAPYIRLLLLLGVRRAELGLATGSEFDLDAAKWTIPAARMKNADGHVVPLPAAAIDILRKIPRSASPHVFPPGRDYTVMKRQLDTRIAAINEGVPLPPWTLHDIRRTFRTGLSSLQIAPHIAELCIAHKQKGIVGVYDLHRFDQEKKFAFDAWAAKLLSIVSPVEDKKVVSLRP